MTEVTTDKPKRKRASFTRTVKPLFGLLRVRNPETGEDFVFGPNDVSLVIERDSAKMLQAVVNGSASGVLVQIQLPQADKKPAAQ